MYTYKGKNYEEEYQIINDLLADQKSIDQQTQKFDYVVSEIKRHLPEIKNLRSEHHTQKEQFEIDRAYTLLTKAMDMATIQISEKVFKRVLKFNEVIDSYEDEKDVNFFVIKFEEENEDIVNHIKLALRAILRVWSAFEKFGMSDRIRESIYNLLNVVGEYVKEIGTESKYTVHKLCDRLVELVAEDEENS